MQLKKRNNNLGLFRFIKGFDTIDHDILLHKLDYYGFRGTVLDWFRDYLSKSTQYVSYTDSKLEIKTILCGVPQGSILGPLLFILYINDITNTSTLLDLILFAADTTILYSSSDIVSKIPLINTELTEVSNWFKANTKTNYMIMGTKYVTSMEDEGVRDGSQIRPQLWPHNLRPATA